MNLGILVLLVVLVGGVVILGILNRGLRERVSNLKLLLNSEKNSQAGALQKYKDVRYISVILSCRSMYPWDFKADSISYTEGEYTAKIGEEVAAVFPASGVAGYYFYSRREFDN